MRLASGLAKIRSPSSVFVAGPADCLSSDLSSDFSGVFSGFLSSAGGDFASASCSSCFGAAPPPEDVSAPSSALASSPSSSNSAITALTATPSVPSATRIFPILPSSTASTSMVALSVSISAITSPLSTVSPSLTTHFASLPSVMVGESAGIRTLIGMVQPPLGVANRFNGLENMARFRQRQFFEVRSIWHRHIDA